MKRRVRKTPSQARTETKTSSTGKNRSRHKGNRKTRQAPVSRMMARRNKGRVIRIPSGPKELRVHVHRSGSISIDSRNRQGKSGAEIEANEELPMKEKQVLPRYKMLTSPASTRSSSPVAPTGTPFSAAALSSADVSALVGMEREWELRRLSTLSELQHEYEQSLNAIQAEVSWTFLSRTHRIIGPQKHRTHSMTHTSRCAKLHPRLAELTKRVLDSSNRLSRSKLV